MLSVHVDRHNLIQVVEVVHLVVELDPQARGLVLNEHRVVHMRAAARRIGHGIVARRAVADHAALHVDVARDLALAHRQQFGDRNLFGLLEGARHVGLRDGKHARHRSPVSRDTHPGLPRFGTRVRGADEGLTRGRELPDGDPRGIGRIDQFGHPVDIRLDPHGEGLTLGRDGPTRLLDVDRQRRLGAVWLKRIVATGSPSTTTFSVP